MMRVSSIMLSEPTSFSNLSNWSYESSVKKVLTPVSPEWSTSSRLFSTYFSLPIDLSEQLLKKEEIKEPRLQNKREKLKVRRNLKK